MNVSDLVTRNVFNQPNKVAIIDGDEGKMYTWSGLEVTINKLANALRNIGVKKGDIVAIYLPNSPEFIFSYFAVIRIGAIALPFNILFKTREILHILEDSGASALVGSSIEVERYVIKERAKLPNLENIITVGSSVEGCLDFQSIIIKAPEEIETIECSHEELASLVYTSGTSGRPKGAMISHGNLMAISDTHVRFLLINDQDLLLTGSPFSHIFFVMSVLGPFNAGAGIVTMQRFSPKKTLELISRYRVTHFCGVPTMYIYITKQSDTEEYDTSSWRFAHSAGASMPAEYIKEIQKRFDVVICETYGTTETSSTITYNRLGHVRSGSVGPVACGVEVRVINEFGEALPAGEIGEILVRGPGVFKGYRGMQEETKKAFLGEWYRTGDMGKYDEDGYFYIADRKSNMIVSGGYNIYPREVEEVLYSHPKVMEAAVLGTKDPVLNQVPKAYIVLKKGEEMTSQELIDFCMNKLACYKVPRDVEFFNELPKNSSGKILKRVLNTNNQVFLN